MCLVNEGAWILQISIHSQSAISYRYYKRQEKHTYETGSVGGRGGGVHPHWCSTMFRLFMLGGVRQLDMASLCCWPPGSNGPSLQHLCYTHERTYSVFYCNEFLFIYNPWIFIKISGYIVDKRLRLLRSMFMLLFMLLFRGLFVLKIDALDQWCLRKLLGIKWYHHVRNDEVRRKTTNHACRLLSKHGVFLCSAILQECQTRQMPGVS